MLSKKAARVRIQGMEKFYGRNFTEEILLLEKSTGEVLLEKFYWRSFIGEILLEKFLPEKFYWRSFTGEILTGEVLLEKFY